MKDIQIPENVLDVLHRLKITDPILLGKGGEGWVFTYKDDLVIKIYNSDATEDYLQTLKELQAVITSKQLPFATPQILEIGKINNTYYTFEKRLEGVLMDDKFLSLTKEQQYKSLKSYCEAIKALNSIEFVDLPYGNILQTSHGQITGKTWHEFLLKMLQHRLSLAGEKVENDVIDFSNKVQLFSYIVNKELVTKTKSLVHADYFVNQVLLNEDNEISAILDISAHALVGDKRLDVANIFFFDGAKGYTKDHVQYLVDLSVQNYGESILKYNDIYRLYYCFYFAYVHSFMPEWYQTILKNLNDELIWKRMSTYLKK